MYEMWEFNHPTNYTKLWLHKEKYTKKYQEILKNNFFYVDSSFVLFPFNFGLNRHPVSIEWEVCYITWNSKMVSTKTGIGKVSNIERSTNQFQIKAGEKHGGSLTCSIHQMMCFYSINSFCSKTLSFHIHCSAAVSVS